MRFARYLLMPAAVAAALLLPLAAATAGSSPPRAGVLTWNTPVCGADKYVPVNLGHGDYFNVANAQAGNTCISVERHHLVFQVTSWSPDAPGWQYPHIASGVNWGVYTCYDGRSARPGHGSQCMRYPVRQEDDGMPVTSASYWIPRDYAGNVSYDIWFDRQYHRPQDIRQADGAEIMIWLDGRVWPQALKRVAVIDHREWYVMAWVMRHNGKSWNYVAYVAVRPTRSISGLWLNQVFRDAERHDDSTGYSPDLMKTWWLDSINFGGEINGGGRGFDVSSYSLSGVR